MSDGGSSPAPTKPAKPGDAAASDNDDATGAADRTVQLRAARPGRPAADDDSGESPAAESASARRSAGAVAPKVDLTKPEVKPSVADDDEDEQDEERRRRRLPAWVELPLMLAFGLLVVVVLHSYVAQPFVIPSGSMEHTLEVGDRVLVNKLAYTFGDRPQRGDVVVFDGTGIFTDKGKGHSSNPFGKAFEGVGSMFGFGNSDETDFVKRVIGVGGDHVICCDAHGRVTVNGVPLDESGYLYPGDVPSAMPFNVIVPKGELWVMGDHRSNSADSREHIAAPGGGFVPEDRVIGRVDWIIWPLGRMGGVDRPSTFSQPGIGRQEPAVVPGRG